MKASLAQTSASEGQEDAVLGEGETWRPLFPLSPGVKWCTLWRVGFNFPSGPGSCVIIKTSHSFDPSLPQQWLPWLWEMDEWSIQSSPCPVQSVLHFCPRKWRVDMGKQAACCWACCVCNRHQNIPSSPAFCHYWHKIAIKCGEVLDVWDASRFIST